MCQGWNDLETSRSRSRNKLSHRGRPEGTISISSGMLLSRTQRSTPASVKRTA